MFGAQGGSVKQRQRRRLENAMPDVIANVLTVGSGRGPVHHFHPLWTEDRAP